MKVSSIDLLADTAVVRDDKSRSSELEDTIETEKNLLDIEAMLQEQADYSVLATNCRSSNSKSIIKRKTVKFSRQPFLNVKSRFRK